MTPEVPLPATLMLIRPKKKSPNHCHGERKSVGIIDKERDSKITHGKKEKNDRHRTKYLCDTDNWALLQQTTTVSVEITILSCRLYYFLVTITFFLLETVTK